MGLFRLAAPFEPTGDQPAAIHGLVDLAQEGVTFVNRQAGSGTRVLLDYELYRGVLFDAKGFGAW